MTLQLLRKPSHRHVSTHDCGGGLAVRQHAFEYELRTVPEAAVHLKHTFLMDQRPLAWSKVDIFPMKSVTGVVI